MCLANADEVNAVHKSRRKKSHPIKFKRELLLTNLIILFLFYFQFLFRHFFFFHLQAIKNFPSQLAAFPSSFSQLQLASHLFSTAIHHVRLDFLREPHLATL